MLLLATKQTREPLLVTQVKTNAAKPTVVVKEDNCLLFIKVIEQVPSGPGIIEFLQSWIPTSSAIIGNFTQGWGKA